MDKPILQAALKGELIVEESVECKPEKCLMLCWMRMLISLARKYFSRQAWMIVQSILKQKESSQSGHVLCAIMIFTVNHQSFVNPAWSGTTSDVLA